MPLVDTADLMREASARGSAVGAFNVIHLETAEALAQAAEAAGHGLILQISQNCAEYHGGLAPIALATLEIARTSTARLAVHLDHAESADLAREAIDLGFGSIMFDGALLEYEANVAATTEVARYAHAHGKHIEAELGEIGGKSGAHAFGARTDPAEAARFVRETEVDSLAVAVGSSHAMTERTASVDLELIARLHEAVPVPLVLHGSSGVSDASLVAAVRSGMTKINVSTHLNRVFTERVREYLAANPATVDSRKYLGAGRAALAVEAARLITLFSLASTSVNATKSGTHE